MLIFLHEMRNVLMESRLKKWGHWQDLICKLWYCKVQPSYFVILGSRLNPLLHRGLQNKNNPKITKIIWRFTCRCKFLEITCLSHLWLLHLIVFPSPCTFDYFSSDNLHSTFDIWWQLWKKSSDFDSWKEPLVDLSYSRC